MRDERRDLTSVVYCVLPADLAAELHEPVRAFYGANRHVQVIVERRGQERRRPEDRRQVDQGPPSEHADRRRLRARAGRRIAERRAALVPTSEPALPPAAVPHAQRITFVERLEPSTLEREDRDTARLIARIQAGERSLFDQLYMRYFDRVYAYLRVTLNDLHEAEDVTQDVFMRVLEALPRYERRTAPFRAWLFRIVRNCAITRIRQRQRLTVEAPEDLSDRGALEFVPAADSLDWLNDRSLLAMIEELPLSQRQVIVLRYMMEFRSTEISKILDRSPDAVRQLHQRAMLYLRKKINDPAAAESPQHTRVQRESMVRLRGPSTVTTARRMALR